MSGVSCGTVDVSPQCAHILGKLQLTPKNKDILYPMLFKILTGEFMRYMSLFELLETSSTCHRQDYVQCVSFQMGYFIILNAK